MIVASVFRPWRFATPVNGDAARRDMWAGHIERCLAADMTVKEWCALNKVAESSLYKWMALNLPRFLVQLHGLLLELGRVLGRWGSHACLLSSVARIMRNVNRLVNGNGADSDSRLRSTGWGTVISAVVQVEMGRTLDNAASLDGTCSVAMSKTGHNWEDERNN